MKSSAGVCWALLLVGFSKCIGWYLDMSVVLKRYYKIIQTEKRDRKQGEKPINPKKNSQYWQEKDTLT